MQVARLPGILTVGCHFPRAQLYGSPQQPAKKPFLDSLSGFRHPLGAEIHYNNSQTPIAKVIKKGGNDKKPTKLGKHSLVRKT